jgi:hypothetical protein
MLRAQDAAIRPDGGMYISGVTTAGPDNQPEAAVLRLDAAGKELWRRSFPGPRKEMCRAEAVAVMPDGGCVLGCWMAESYSVTSDIYFIRLKP